MPSLHSLYGLQVILTVSVYFYMDMNCFGLARRPRIVSGGSGWFQVVSGGFGWFRVVSCFSSYDFLNHKSVFPQILHQFSVSSTITPLYFFSWNILYFGQKQPLKCKALRFSSLWVNFWLNSSCQFWTVMWIPLQLLHHSSLSWHIAPL